MAIDRSRHDPDVADGLAVWRDLADLERKADEALGAILGLATACECFPVSTDYKCDEAERIVEELLAVGVEWGMRYQHAQTQRVVREWLARRRAKQPPREEAPPAA